MRPFAVVRTVIAASLFLTVWMWWVPRWLLRVPLAVVHPIAWVPFAIGFAAGAWCALEFAVRGLGTPAPFDPPRRLVVNGLYRYVRNPMYIAFGIALASEAWLVGCIEILYELLALGILVNMFLFVYEEPQLRRLFGDEYADYCRHVPRWIPRLTPFRKAGLES